PGTAGAPGDRGSRASRVAGPGTGHGRLPEGNGGSRPGVLRAGCTPPRRRGGAGGKPVTRVLSRNRNYRLLWTSQMLSEFGIHGSLIAFPLLVLAVTGSAAASGLVMGTTATAQVLAGLPAG